MEKQQQIEWSELQRAAEQRMHDGLWRLRLARQTSFRDWMVVGLTKSSTILVRQWHRGKDSEKFATLVERMRHPTNVTPTIAEVSRKIDAGTAEELMQSFAALAVPLCPQEESIVLDGTQYSIAVWRGMNQAELRWNRVSVEWKGVAAWFDGAWQRMLVLAGF